MVNIPLALLLFSIGLGCILPAVLITVRPEGLISMTRPQEHTAAETLLAIQAVALIGVFEIVCGLYIWNHP